MKTALLALALSTTLCVARAADPVFATVDGTAIAAAEYEAALSDTVRQKFYHREVPEAKLDEFRREVAQSLVDRVLLAAEARRRGLKPDAARIASQVAEYDARYAQSERWKKSREGLLPGLTQRLEQRDVLEQLQAAVRDGPEPTEAQLAAYYESHRELFTEPEQAHLAVILLKVDPSAPAASWALATEEAASIRARAAAGADFAALARLHSTDGSAANGGDMGYLHAGMLPDALFAQLGAMKNGDLSQPTRLLEGVAIFRLIDRKPARRRPLADVKERAAQLWRRDAAEQRWSEFMTGLRGAAAIQIDTARYPALAGLYAAGQGVPRAR